MILEVGLKKIPSEGVLVLLLGLGDPGLRWMFSALQIAWLFHLRRWIWIFHHSRPSLPIPQCLRPRCLLSRFPPRATHIQGIYLATSFLRACGYLPFIVRFIFFWFLKISKQVHYWTWLLLSNLWISFTKRSVSLDITTFDVSLGLQIDGIATSVPYLPRIFTTWTSSTCGKSCQSSSSRISSGIQKFSAWKSKSVSSVVIIKSNFVAISSWHKMLE